jgi:hypothetical protein
MDVENGDKIALSSETREGVAHLTRALSFLDSKAIRDSIDAKELQADDYDVNVSVSDWLYQKRVAKRRARILQFAVAVGLAVMVYVVAAALIHSTK